MFGMHTLTIYSQEVASEVQSCMYICWRTPRKERRAEAWRKLPPRRVGWGTTFLETRYGIIFSESTRSQKERRCWLVFHHHRTSLRWIRLDHQKDSALDQSEASFRYESNFSNISPFSGYRASCLLWCFCNDPSRSSGSNHHDYWRSDGLPVWLHLITFSNF